MSNDTALMDTKQAAEYLGVAEITLKVARSQGRGPRYVRPERNPRWIRYRKADLDDYRKDMDSAVQTFASRTMALADALAEITDRELDDQFAALFAASGKAASPRMRNLYQRMTELVMIEFARRGRSPAGAITRRRPSAPEKVMEPSPYL